MKKLMFVSFAFALLASAVCLAQDAAPPSSPTVAPVSQATPDQKPATAAKTLTGCLQKGDQPGEVSLTAANGTWDLRSDSVKLEQHIGHQVSVTGTPTRETKAEEKKEGTVEKAAGKEAVGELNVTDVKMVSETCTK